MVVSGNASSRTGKKKPSDLVTFYIYVKSSKLTFGIGLQLGRDPFLLFVKVNDL
jgi:hypothetical protein